jgi:hypothetical protein
MKYLWLFVVAVGVAATRVRDAPFSFTPTPDSSRRRLSLIPTQVYAIQTDVDVSHLGGFVEIVSVNTFYVIGPDTPAFARATSWAAIEPGHKLVQHGDAGVPPDAFLVKRYGIPQLRGCRFKLYSEPYLYIGTCKDASSIQRLVEDGFVWSIDHVPRLAAGGAMTVNQSPPRHRRDLATLAPLPSLSMSITDDNLDVAHDAFYQNPDIRVIGANGGLNNDHGSGVASRAIGSRNGASPGAPLVFGDISEANSNSIFYSSDYFSNFFVYNNTVVHSMSWVLTGQPGYYTDVDGTFDRYFRLHPWVTPFGAAPNSGNGTQLSTPGVAKQVASCGALTANRRVASFVATAPLYDGRTIVPRMYSYGVNVVIAKSSATPALGHADYGEGSGCSYSTPFIAGVALHEARRDWIHLGRKTTATLALARLQARPDMLLKAGTDLSIPPSTGDLVDYEPLPEPRRTWSRIVTVAATIVQPVKLAVSWIDPEVAARVEHTLVNDLDVLLIPLDGSANIEQGTDAFHSFEEVFTPAAKTFRLVVFAYGNRTAMGPVRFGVSMAAEVSQFSAAPGDCMPGEIIACANNTQQQCRGDGSWTPCSSCLPGYIPSGEELCTCAPDIYEVRNGLTISICGRRTSSSLSGGASVKYLYSSTGHAAPRVSMLMIVEIVITASLLITKV